MSDKYKRRYEKRKANRLCVICGIFLLPEDGVNCFKCKKKAEDRIKKRIETSIKTGLCKDCQSPSLFNRTLCAEHTFKVKASNYLRDSNRWHELEQLLINQENKCKYCKILITIGGNAEVDHIQPKSRFPELINDITNLQWLCELCNTAKSNRTEDEFFTWAARLLESI